MPWVVILLAAALLVELHFPAGQGGVDVAAPDPVPGKAHPFRGEIGGAAVHAGGEGIAPHFHRHEVEHQGGGDDTLVTHLLAQTELLGKVEAHRVLDEVAEEDLGAGIGEGVADIGIEQRAQTAFAAGGAQIIDTAVAVVTGIEVGLVAAGIDSAQQKTGPAGLAGDLPQIGVGGGGDQQAKAQQNMISHRVCS